MLPVVRQPSRHLHQKERFDVDKQRTPTQRHGSAARTSRKHERTHSVQSATWETVRLGDFVTLKRGYDLSSSQRVPGPVPIVSSSGITGYHNVAKVMGPGVVTGRYGTLGKVFFVKKDFWPLNTSLYVENFKGNNPRFTAYFLKHVLATTTGDNKAAVPGHNRNDLHGLSVRVTRDTAEQDSIASVLAAYDDLIENNRRRIRLLEQAARMLYEEWFVRLRFPGHEGMTVTDGVPEGWKTKPLSALCNDVRESVNPKTLPPDTAYIGLEHMPRRSITLNEWASSVGVESAKLAFGQGDVLFGKIRPYFHKVGFTLTDGIASSDAIVIRPADPDDYEYLLSLLSSDGFVSLASKTVREGSKMPRADWRFLSASDVLVPEPPVLNAFRRVIRPVLDQLRNLALSNRRLAAARDLLLPRLMSGTFSV